jgi:hypothetical protein
MVIHMVYFGVGVIVGIGICLVALSLLVKWPGK